MLCVPLLNSVHTKTSATSQNYFQVLDFFNYFSHFNILNVCQYTDIKAT